MGSLKICTQWSFPKNARNGMFKKMHGMGSLKTNGENGKFKKMH